MNNILHQEHWELEDYTQRLTSKEWSELVLNNMDKIVFKGRVRSLICHKLGYGILEVYKKPYDRTTDNK